MSRSLALSAYLGATRLADGYARRKLDRRLSAGKEDRERLNERVGAPAVPRPAGPLVWFHAASVGESLSILELLRRLSEDWPGVAVLVTTGTRSSASLLALRLPKTVLHQYVPVDTKRAVAGFLDHWRPDLAIWTESEFWPRLMVETHRRGVPMVLINGRMSQSSADRWRWLPGMARSLIRRFDLLVAQDQDTGRRLIDLGAPKDRIVVSGSLKEGAVPLPHDEEERRRLVAEIGRRPVWLAASTHAGEEEIAIAAHKRALRRHPDLLTILAPRHPERSDAVKELILTSGLRVARRSDGDRIEPETDVYLADTLGEMGLWYRIAPVSFVGGSMEPIGGHNPFEPAALGSAILHGPHVANFADIYARLQAEKAAREVPDAEALAEALSDCLQPDIAATMAAAAWAVSSDGSSVTDRVVSLLEPYLDRLAEPAA